MTELTKLVLLYGGQSSEHEVSCMSAASVLRAFDENTYAVTPIGMDKQGRFYLNDRDELRDHLQALPVKTDRSILLPSLLKQENFIVDADVVFPVAHGSLYEDGCLQGLLELAGVAYVGSGVLSSAVGMHKEVSRRLVCDEAIVSARYLLLTCNQRAEQRPAVCQKAVAQFGWPLFVKPCSLGSSIGVHRVNNLVELQKAVDDAFRYDEEVLIEEYISGREIELAVLESTTPYDAPRVSLPGEIKVNHADGFYSYAAKYLDPNDCGLDAPAKDLSPETVGRLQQMAAEIFIRLKCKGMARVDFFVEPRTEKIYFNEINTIPGFTAISMYPKLWAVSGLKYDALLAELVQLAKQQHMHRQQLTRAFKQTSSHF
ncbi:MAG: D-alanine--D-alanine ligase [Legionella sp.]|nr:D-alanine--D-alanine ligase [Legionella sp.]